MVKRAPMRRRPLRVRRGVRPALQPLAAIAVGALLVTTSACSSGANPNDVNATQTPFSASSETTTATGNAAVNTSPSPGAVASSDKQFAFVVPNGWNLTTQPKTLVYLSSATVAHDVAPTIVVTRSSVTPAPALDDTLRLATQQARQDGQTVSAAPNRTVGGETAVSFTATAEEKNVDVKRTYVMVAHEKALYFITLTGAEADSGRDESTLTTLLASWTWTKKGDAASTPSGTAPAVVPTTTSTPAAPSSSSAPSSSGASASGSSGAASGSASASPTSGASSSAGKPTASSSAHPTSSHAASPSSHASASASH